MSEKTQFDKSLKLMKTCLLLSGIQVYRRQWHPVVDILIKSGLYYFNILILYTVVFAEIYWLVDGIQNGKDFVEMSLTAPCITISILSTLKSMPVFCKRDVVCQIIETLREIHPIATNENDYEKVKNTGLLRKLYKNNEDVDLEEKSEKQMTDEELASESVNLLKFVANLLAVISIAVLIAFLLAPLVLIYVKYYNTGSMKIRYPYYVKYWFDAYKVKLWQLMYFHQVWATIIVCLGLFATENLFYTLCTYMEMHFRILCNRFESIQPGSSMRVQEELIAAVKRHQLLIHLVKQCESLFSLPVLFHIVTSSLLICLSAFNISVVKELGTVFAFITFLSLSMSQVSLLCYFGDKLMKSSTEVSGAIYKCPWYDFDVNAKKVVLIIMMRAQKPCKLTACNFADLNLRAFTTILSRSWSYFALLKTVYK